MIFNVLTGRKFEFTVNSKPQLDGAWTVAIEPITQQAQGDLEYERWVQDRKAMVEKATNGEIGYLHIRAMKAPSLERFERDLIENLGKKALIIDERFNGGGGIDQELLEILNQRKKYESYRARDSWKSRARSRHSSGPWWCCKTNAPPATPKCSRKDSRRWGWQSDRRAYLWRGDRNRVVQPAGRLDPPHAGNGSLHRDRPRFENYGVPPDVYIDNTPADFIAGHDRQVEKAIEVLRSEMK